MILQIGIRKSDNHPPSTRGFTLIEIIVVMAMLSAVIALAMPSLSRFFRGRSAQEEARRFLALTRYARSEAISMSIPMTLWIDADQPYYGLNPAEGYETDTFIPMLFTLDDDVRFEFTPISAADQGYVKIEFKPDGTIEQNELEALYITRENEEPIIIMRARYGVTFEVYDNESGRLYVRTY